MPRTDRTRLRRSQRRIEQIAEAVAGMDLVCSGTLIERKKTCGKPNCRCATDLHAWHGPYYEWSRRHEGRLVHKILSPEQARQIQRAIDNYREIQDLLARWELESIEIILGGG